MANGVEGLAISNISSLTSSTLNPNFSFIYGVFFLKYFIFKFLNNWSEEHINNKAVNCFFMVHVKQSPKILDSLGSFLIFHGKNKIKESLVIHFTFKSLIFFENSINKNVSQSPRIFG